MTSVSACSSRPVSWRTCWIRGARSLRETSSRVAKKSRFSRAERRGKNERSAATAMPTCRRTSPASRRSIKSTHAYRSRIGQQHGRDQLQGCSFSAAVRPEQRQHLRASRRERYVFQGYGLAAPFPSHPIKQGGTMTKYLANGFEDDSIHENQYPVPDNERPANYYATLGPKQKHLDTL